MRRASFWAAALLFLAACSSTAPGAGTSTGGATAGASANPAPAASAAVASTAETDGPVTPTMARLLIGGERHAAMGDPDAPLTIVEYSDYG